MAQHKRPGNEMIYAVSGDPNEKRTKPRQVPAKLKGTAAWKNHKYREVPDPNAEPEPVKITPLPTVSTTADAGPSAQELIAQLQADNKALRERQTPINSTPVTATPEPTFAEPTIPEAPKRGPGRPPKDKTKA